VGEKIILDVDGAKGMSEDVVILVDSLLCKVEHGMIPKERWLVVGVVLLSWERVAVWFGHYETLIGHSKSTSWLQHSQISTYTGRTS
jgi:hypothetical protein